MYISIVKLECAKISARSLTHFSYGHALCKIEEFLIFFNVLSIISSAILGIITLLLYTCTGLLIHILKSLVTTAD